MSVASHTLVVNPAVADAEVIARLNESFGNWGGQREYDRWYRRVLGPAPTDLLFLRRGELLVAGCSLMYRRLHAPDGAQATAAIISGAWTVPEERRTGCYMTMLRELRAVAAQRGAHFAMSYISAERPNLRATEGVAAGTRPSWRLVLPASRAPAPATGYGIEPLAPALAGLDSARAGVAPRYDPRALADHVADQNGEVALVDAADGQAIVAHQHDTDRVEAVVSGDRQAVLEALLARARAAGRGLFAFTTRAADTAWAREHGLEVKPGSVGLLEAHPDGGSATEWARRDWDLQEVDRA